MQVKVGKSYRFVAGVSDEIVTVSKEDGGAGEPTFWFKVQLSPCANTTTIFALKDGSVGIGACWGRLVELEPIDVHQINGEIVTPTVVESSPAPMLGDDSGSLDRFRRVFATWDFSQFAR